ncbi:hypothetical protein GTO89_01630 [Heliobacterium gestii]|uniref:Uncharacterized protein n=1 Tax=Heliomicrobium gestii TaxID=2699 RepID=A0A845L9X4_HELGE|nr:hypothetical protein [Heliomicrobium gestii]MBM7865478.1 geranylgeranyl pyrophosphate synthase [Heliomicrobium gestii]MZP41730.1 hypothetical protein [Heliomicrobium gestii]
MSIRMWESILPELSKVRARLDDRMPEISKQHLRFMGLGSYDVHKMFPAILVLLATRMFGAPSLQANCLASAVQFIQTGTDIHRTIPDEGRGLRHLEQATIPFSVLVGDLYYSQFLSLLCEGELLEYLTPISRMVCRVHEGGVLRKELVEPGFATDEHIMSMREMEFASLPALSCRIAGELCGASPRQLAALEQLGRAVGLLAGCRMLAAPSDEVAEWLDEAHEALCALPQGAMAEAFRVLLSQLDGCARHDGLKLPLEKPLLEGIVKPRVVVV